MKFIMSTVSLVSMSRKSIHISIPSPCHELWDRMDATERGAFCHRCQKEVIDFSTMTDREVIEYLAKHQTGCGRFRKDQLDTKLSIAEVNNGVFKWRALFLGILSFMCLKSSMALPNYRRVAADQNAISAKPLIETKKTIPPKITVSGNVTTEAGILIDEAVVEVVDSAGEYIGPSAMVDEKGVFSMVLDGPYMQQHGAKLKIVAAAYKGYRSEIKVLTNEPVQKYCICLIPLVIEIKEIVQPLISDIMTGQMVVHAPPVKVHEIDSILNSGLKHFLPKYPRRKRNNRAD